MKLKELLAPMSENSKVSFLDDRFAEIIKVEAIEKFGEREVIRYFPDSYRLCIEIK